jgi:putative flippase GtrA
MKAIKKLFSFFWDKSLLIFAIIGGLNTVISMVGSFLLRTQAGWGLYASTAIMFAVCSVASFYFNRKYSFKSKAPLGQSILRFTVVVVVCFHLSFLLNNFVMPWMRTHWFPNISDMCYSAIEIVGIQVVFTLLNYVGQRLWAFQYKQEDKEDTAPKAESEEEQEP